MRLIPSDPDIETIVRRIEQGELDLQPDFQRGEVWSKAKQQRLIDSILRQWHVPPLHEVETDEGAEVLDGQQRLVAIREFVRGHFPVDGKTEPRNADIEALDGLTYRKLPRAYRRKFNKFPIRLFTIIDYQVGEPAELFYRLNQPLTLTTPEQRNAFFGPVRDQIRDLVATYEGRALDKKFLGFSNSRMSYDDVISRNCYALEKTTIRTKITAALLADRYRKSAPFPSEVVERADLALSLLSEARARIPKKVRFNKATLFSWLWLVSSHQDPSLFESDRLAGFVTSFEAARRRTRSGPDLPPTGGFIETPLMHGLLRAFHDRASSRVADIFSVLVRDFALWAFLYSYVKELDLETVLTPDKKGALEKALAVLRAWEQQTATDQVSGEGHEERVPFEVALEQALMESDWGAIR